MIELDEIYNFYGGAEKRYINYLQEAFSTARIISEKEPEFVLPISEGVQSKTTCEMNKLASLLRFAYVLASLREQLSTIEIVLFKECIHRAKEALLKYNDPILRVYYIGVFNTLEDLIQLHASDSIEHW